MAPLDQKGNGYGKKIGTEFGKGGKFIASLFMNEALKVRGAFLKALPRKVKVRQAIASALGWLFRKGRSLRE
jgi:hypothetical protein